MADFSTAVAKTELFEGGYSNNPKDSGGETYRGISRNNWPSWTGWSIVDQIKQDSPMLPLDILLDRNLTLQGEVVDFYRKNFWQYDGLNDQDVAWKVFDLSVNVGKVHAIKILQQAVGTNQDGVYGPDTEKLSNSHPKGSLAGMIRTSAEKYHEAIVQSHPEDVIFLGGWIKRDEA